MAMEMNERSLRHEIEPILADKTPRLPAVKEGILRPAPEKC
jgi:hypothetical protein